jgi:hybrid cluster-associated redox disulfide protein
MTGKTISLSMTVAEVLSEFPAAASAFVARRLGCVGCDMAAFETIDDVAANYRLNAAELLSDIRKASRQKPSTKHK